MTTFYYSGLEKLGWGNWETIVLAMVLAIPWPGFAQGRPLLRMWPSA